MGCWIPFHSIGTECWICLAADYGLWNFRVGSNRIQHSHTTDAYVFAGEAGCIAQARNPLRAGAMNLLVEMGYGQARADGFNVRTQEAVLAKALFNSSEGV